MPTTPDRFLWALDIIAVKPDENILEIGCGVGILAELILEKLSGGSFTAIDRSAPFIAKAIKRNEKYIGQGKAEFIQSEFLNSDFQDHSFDKIIAFNVNFFWKDVAKEFELINKYLKSEGKLYVFYQLPYGINIDNLKPMIQSLEKNGFDVLDVSLSSKNPENSFCIIARC
jgi:ubiquinone/menaquinone biosynthesis C-methylase UbiE